MVEILEVIRFYIILKKNNMQNNKNKSPLMLNLINKKNWEIVPPKQHPVERKLLCDNCSLEIIENNQCYDLYLRHNGKMTELYKDFFTIDDIKESISTYWEDIMIIVEIMEELSNRYSDLRKKKKNQIEDVPF